MQRAQLHRRTWSPIETVLPVRLAAVLYGAALFGVVLLAAVLLTGFAVAGWPVRSDRGADPFPSAYPQVAPIAPRS